MKITHRSDPDPTGITQPVSDTGRIVFYPLFGGKEVIEVPPASGGHGGADSMAKEDLFGESTEESRALGLMAGSERRRPRHRHGRGGCPLHPQRPRGQPVDAFLGLHLCESFVSKGRTSITRNRS